MPSPFPGMAPHLEGYLWPDVHHELASAIRAILAPQISPKYVAKINVYTVTSTIEVKIPVIEIRDRKKNQLVTAIEILSPVNKRKPGLADYRTKRQKLYATGVYLVEIDLIRRGQRPIRHPKLPQKHYLISLIRAGSGKNDVWAIDVKEKLPIIPIPLKVVDPDATLDLGIALDTVYDRSLYHLSIDYNETSPPPTFSKEEMAWIKRLLSTK